MHNRQRCLYRESVTIIEEKNRLRKYLLGQLPEEDEEQLELRLLTDAAYAEEFDIVVDELTDRYVANEFQGEEREQVELYFLKSDDRRDKLKFASALQRARAEQELEGARTEQESDVAGAEKKSEDARAAQESEAARTAQDSEVTKHKQRPPDQRKRSPFNSYLPIAASMLIVLGVGFGVWRAFFYQSDVDKGLLALNAAYHEQRPIQARISGFNYAPPANQRGAQNQTDYLQRDRAASLLLNAVSEHPSAASHRALGQYYLAEHQFDKAIDQFKAALALDPQNAKIHSDLGAALMERGKTYLSDPSQGKGIQDFAESLTHLTKAVELDNSQLEALFNRALLYQDMTLLPQAEADWHTYLQKDPNSKWADEARQNLKLLEEQKKKVSLSNEEIFQEFLKSYQAHDDEGAWHVVSSYHNRTGNVVVEQLLDAYLEDSATRRKDEARYNLQMLSYVGQLEKKRAGDRFFFDLAQFYESSTAEQRESLRRTRTLMKQSHSGWGQFSVAENLKLFTHAKQLFDGVGDVSESQVAEYWISFCYTRQRALEQGRMILEPLTVACELNRHVWLQVRCLYLLSAIEFGLNQHSKAVDSARRCVELAVGANDGVGMLNAMSSLIEYYRYLGNYSKSLSYIQRSLPLISSIALDPIQGSRHYGFVATAFATIGLNVAAEAYQREALRLAAKSGASAAMAYNYAFLGSINGKLGYFTEALRNVRLAFETAQAHSNEAADQDSMAYSSLQMGNIYREMGLFDDAVTNYSRSISLFESLNFSTHLYQAHKGRLMCYIAQEDDGRTKEEIATTLNLIEKYRREIKEENNRNTFFDVEQSVYDIAIDFAVSRMNDPERGFDYLESSRARSLLDLLNVDEETLAKVQEPDIVFPSVSQPLTLSEIRQQMPTEAVILQYAVLDKRVLIWIISNGNVIVIPQAITAKDLTDKVSRYLRMMSPGQNEPEESQLSKELFSILIQPVESLLNGNKQICIVPDKILNYLPFAALISPKSGMYLIDDRVLVVSPSPSVFVLSSKKAAARMGVKDERLLSVGNPAFDHDAYPDLPDLPNASSEATGVAANYQTAILLTGREARPARVKDEMGRSDVIHLAVHSALDDDVPLRSKLLLAKLDGEASSTTRSSESVLYAYELYNLKLSRTRLVVLSACQTGAEHYYGGEGIISLARPFISAGVPLVVASLWPVDSTATAELMISFHRHRRQEKIPTAEALARAQREMLHSAEERFHHPYYWAPFTLIGGYATF